MQRDQRDRILLFLQRVYVRHQRHIFQELAQLLCGGHIGIVFGDRAQLHHVLPALLALLCAVLQVLLVARLGQHQIQQTHYRQIRS